MGVHKHFGFAQGAEVSASDISQSMADEASRRFEAAVADGASRPKASPQFLTSDLESLTGRFDTVACLDVMIHYPQVPLLLYRIEIKDSALALYMALRQSL